MILVKFKDLEFDEIHYGIYAGGGNIICGCYGGTFSVDEEDETFRVLDLYEANIEEVIKGAMEG